MKEAELINFAAELIFPQWYLDKNAEGKPCLWEQRFGK